MPRILTDIYAEIPVMGGAGVWFDVGTRFQISNSSALDLGVATRLDQWNDGVANVEVVIGVSRAFAMRGRAPDYVRPTTRQRRSTSPRAWYPRVVRSPSRRACPPPNQPRILSA